MIKRLCTLFVALLLPVLNPGGAEAATPFSAPATFDLAGSSVDFTMSVTTSENGAFNLALTPNPMPVTGVIQIDALNKDTGVFTGKFLNISGSAAVSGLGGATAAFTINSDNVSGTFVWSRDKVILYPETLTAALESPLGSYAIPLDGVPFPAEYTDGVMSISSNTTIPNVEYQGNSLSGSAAINLTARLQDQETEGAAWVGVSTDRTAYGVGDALQLFISMGVGSEARIVDVWLGLVTPGQIYHSFSSFDASGWIPVLQNIPLPADFNMPSTLVTDLVLSDVIQLSPDEAGMYNFVFALVDSATGAVVGDIAAAPFTFSPIRVAPDGYDGVWTGSANVSVPGDECSTFGEVRLEISEARISGRFTDAGEVGHPISGVVESGGAIQNGVIYEESAGLLHQVGAFAGNLDTGLGTWRDIHGCSGEFTVVAVR